VLLLPPDELVLEAELLPLFADRLLATEQEVREVTEGAMLELEPIELPR